MKSSTSLKQFCIDTRGLRDVIAPLLQLSESAGSFSGRDFWKTIGQGSPGSFPALPPLFNHLNPKQTLLTGMTGQQRLCSVFVLSVIHCSTFRGNNPELKHNLTPNPAGPLYPKLPGNSPIPWASTGFISAFISQTMNGWNQDQPNHSITGWQLHISWLTDLFNCDSLI